MYKNSYHWLSFSSLVLTFVFVTACNKPKTPLQDGTKAMVARLDSITKNVNPLTDEYANKARVRYYNQIPPPTRTGDLLNYQFNFALELLKDGDTEKAIKRLKEVLDILNGIDPKQLTAKQKQSLTPYKEVVNEYLAISYLRLGEQQNCLSNDTANSCLFSISNHQIYTIRKGSENAIKIYQNLLREQAPDSLISRWLLNIAYMTLGKYPGGVPRQWLIPAKAFKSDYDIKKFPEIALETGLAQMGHAGGAITEDFNNDGFIDVVASSWGLDDQLQYFENNGDGTFTNKTKQAGLTGIVGGLNLRHADYNNDGFPDILVLRGAWLQDAGLQPNSLLRNNGDGTFTDVTKSAGLLSYNPTQTAEWADFNNDGWLDLYIGNESTKSSIHPAELYLSQRDGTFKNVAKEAGVDVVGYIKGVTVGDYNNDGLPDLYVSLLDGPNHLFRNDGPDKNNIPHFTDVTQEAGVAKPIVSFPTWFWDYNNDGWLDLLVFSYDATPGDVVREYLGMPVKRGIPILYRNNGDGTFTDVTSSVGLNKVMYAMGSNFGDLDNDGYPDFYVGTGDPDFRSLMPNRMFRNDHGKRFQEVTTSGGFGVLEKGHAVCFADLDNDGDQDIYEVLGGAYNGDISRNALFENPGHNNHWITLLFNGQKSNRMGVGNRITVNVETPQGKRSIHGVVTEGGSFGSSTLQQEIGLGRATNIDQIKVFWPASGIKQIFKNVKMDQAYRVSEMSNQLELVKRKRFKLGGESGSLK